VCGGTRPPNGVVCPNDLHVLLPPEEDPLVGKEVGTYQVQKRIGIGGMGAVYEAVEKNIARRAALKIVHPHLSENPRLPGLLAEARAVNAIGDEGIVDIYGFGTLPDGRSYLVMELLEGELLDSLLKSKGKLSLLEAIDLSVPLLTALQAAHAAGFVHRDIKASNVFVVKKPNRAPFPKLLDFGIAHALGATSAAAVGTPEYVAPEQAQNKNLGPKTDLYAFGCLFYELLTGHVPFRDDDPMKVVRMQFSAPRPHVRDERPDLPEEIDALIVQLLQVDPRARPESAAAVREALLAVRQKLLPRPFPKWPLFGLALVFVALGTYGLVRNTSEPPREPGPPLLPDTRDPTAEAVAAAAAEIEGVLDAGQLAQAEEKLVASRAAFPERPEWALLGARLEADKARSERAGFAERNGMVQVGAVFIDKYEYPNKKGERPLSKVDWEDAVTLCQRAGKHLCSEEEWQTACSGGGARKFPYGENFQKGLCWSKGKRGVELPSGRLERCVTAEGVADLSGNLAEWTASDWSAGQPQKVTRGGSFAQSDEKLSCAARDYLLPGQGGAAHVGFRCCL
jgi:tRNA A-37 threonylcarbamoyl transferase component Bud32